MTTSIAWLNSTVVAVCWDSTRGWSCFGCMWTWHALLTQGSKYILCFTCRKCSFSWMHFKPYGLFFVFFAESCFSVCGWPKAPGFIYLFPARCRFLNWETYMLTTALLYLVARAAEILRRGRVNTWTKKRRPARHSADVCWFLGTDLLWICILLWPTCWWRDRWYSWVGVSVLKRATAQLDRRKKGMI